MRYLVTGTAGFIGFHVASVLLNQGHEVIGVDELNAYYDVNLKQARLDQLTSNAMFSDHRISIQDRANVEALFQSTQPQRVIHLAAQAGVRYSIENPHAYGETNLIGFLNILEGCRHQQVEHLTYASSSSVYGANEKLPFSASDNVDHPISLYAATKKANELMAHAYSNLYQLPTTGLRFFTVYGPWGRPDMALFLFTKNIIAGLPIDVFNEGKHRRDFTYIDDIVQGIVRVAEQVATPDPNWSGKTPDPASSSSPYRIYNIGNSRPVELLRYIEIIEDCVGKKAIMTLLPMQPGDVEATAADIEPLRKAVKFEPQTPIEIGIPKFVDWYRQFYGDHPSQ